MISSFWSSDPRQSLAESLWKRKKNVWNRDYSALARCQIVCHFYSIRLVIISRREWLLMTLRIFCLLVCVECSTVSRQRTVRTFWSEQMFIFISQPAQWGRTVLQLGLQLSRYLCHCSGTPSPWRHFSFSFIVLLRLFFSAKCNPPCWTSYAMPVFDQLLFISSQRPMLSIWHSHDRWNHPKRSCFTCKFYFDFVYSAWHWLENAVNLKR